MDAAAEKAEEVKDAAAEVVDGAVDAAAEKVEEAAETVADAAAAVKVMSYAEFAAAQDDDEVVVDAYVMDHQSWWDNKISVYLAAKDGGAYFAYNMACSEEDAAKLTAGTKIRVTGYKTSWAGEVEIAEGATFEILDEEAWIPEAVDVTALVGTDELISHINERVVFKGAKILAREDGAAFNYKNPEEKTDDLYISAEVNGVPCEFCVEFYLRGKDTDVYKAVEALNVGDVVDMEGYLYWYNGANPHIISVTAAQ